VALTAIIQVAREATAMSRICRGARTTSVPILLQRPQVRTLAAMAKPQRIEVNESANISVVRFKDQKIIDPVAIQELGQELFDLVEKDERRKIVLNFGNVEFLSSAALGKLITFEKKAKRIGAELILTNISPEIYQVFAITNLDKLFKIKDSEADALAVL
jgi:anti-sigma B factor antagonist